MPTVGNKLNNDRKNVTWLSALALQLDPKDLAKNFSKKNYSMIWYGSVAVSPDPDQEVSSRQSCQHHTSWTRWRPMCNKGPPNPGYLAMFYDPSPSTYKVFMQTQETRVISWTSWNLTTSSFAHLQKSACLFINGQKLLFRKPNTGKLGFNACLDCCCSAVSQQTTTMRWVFNAPSLFSGKFITLTKVPCAINSRASPLNSIEPM